MIPAFIIHGRNDQVCPLDAGLMLCHALPNAEFRVLPSTGHVARGEEMIDALVSVADRMAEILNTNSPEAA